MTTSAIQWIPAVDRLPDDDECVLVALADGEVWTGFIDGDEWRYVTADPMAEPPAFWARFPEPPRDAARPR